MNDKANIESVTKQEFIDYINKENKFYSLKKLEDSEVFNYIGAPMLVEKQVNKIDYYLWYITKVYHCVDGFVGVTGVDVIYSDMDADDFCETCHAEEYSPIPSTKYVPKSSIESVSFNSQQRFGKLVVKEYVETNKTTHVEKILKNKAVPNGMAVTYSYDAGNWYICQCDCGNITYVKRGQLINGQTKSCGCLKNKGE